MLVRSNFVVIVSVIIIRHQYLFFFFFFWNVRKSGQESIDGISQYEFYGFFQCQYLEEGCLWPRRIKVRPIRRSPC